jgi:hypothetical protein
MLLQLLINVNKSAAGAAGKYPKAIRKPGQFLTGIGKPL